jgi:uncharacterized membrane-anchored protein YhcB (DUF1043 family)
MNLKMNTIIVASLLLFSHSFSCVQHGSSDNSTAYYKTLSIGVSIGFTAASVLWYGVVRSKTKQATKKVQEENDRQKFEMETEKNHITEHLQILTNEKQLISEKLAKYKTRNKLLTDLLLKYLKKTENIHTETKPSEGTQLRWYQNLFRMKR